MELFKIIHPDLFKPLSGKYKETFVTCLVLIYQTYRLELSFGVDREVIVDVLERYFDTIEAQELVFEDEGLDNETAIDSRGKASAILRRLKSCGWLEYETGADYRVKVILVDYGTTLIEAFLKVGKNQEMEYQSLVSQIHGTLMNQEAYVKPYEYIVKRVAENTEELILGLKKLNTHIKKYIDAITNDKSANEIVQDFFIYHKEIGSKAYHRIKTSDNVSYFRAAIMEALYRLMMDEELYKKGIAGYQEIEQINDYQEAEACYRELIQQTRSAFISYDAILKEIDEKNARYINSAIARAKFLLTNTNNQEGKIARILGYLADEMNQSETMSLVDEGDEQLLKIFSIFPQNFVDSDSLYTLPISKKSGPPEKLQQVLGLSETERQLRLAHQRSRDANRFSRKNINSWLYQVLEGKKELRASELTLVDPRDLIRILFISLYGRDPKSNYHIEACDEFVSKGDYRFRDFIIYKR